MKHPARRYLWLGLLLSACSASNEENSNGRRQVLTELARVGLVPSYEAFAQKARALQSAAQNCDRAAVQSAWREAQAAWMRTEFYQAGPIRDQRFDSAINFWPIRIATIEEELTQTSTFTKAYVDTLRAAAKGLPVIEYLVFQEALEGRRCAYAQGLADGLVTSADSLVDAWHPQRGNFGAQWENAGAAGSDYVSVQRAFDEVTNGLIDLVGTMESQKLSKPIGRGSGGAPEPEQEESRFAQASKDNLLHNLEGLEAAYTGTFEQSGSTSFSALVVQQNPALDASIRAAIQAARSSIEKLTPPLAQAALDAPEDVERAFQALKTLSRLLTADLATLFGVTVTFSDNDGD